MNRGPVQREGEEGNNDFNTGAQQAGVPAVDAHNNSVTSLTVSPDNQGVASSSNDSSIIPLEAETQSVDNSDDLTRPFVYPAMSAEGTAPWDLYAKTMFKHFGYPLWHADPEVDKVFGPREVELGSVGFLDRGEFRHLFNARKTKDDLFNVGRVPESFEVFNPKNMRVIAPEPILRQPYVASYSVRQVAMSLEGNPLR